MISFKTLVTQCWRICLVFFRADWRYARKAGKTDGTAELVVRYLHLPRVLKSEDRKCVEQTVFDSKFGSGSQPLHHKAFSQQARLSLS